LFFHWKNYENTIKTCIIYNNRKTLEQFFRGRCPEREKVIFPSNLTEKTGGKTPSY
jgi:hypothetical protein